MRWEVLVAVAVLCIALRVAAPLLLRGRELPPALEARLHGAIVPLLGALIAVQLFVHDGRTSVDARAPGVAAALLVFAWRRSLLLALLAAAALTAAVRQTT
jgi:branched-subunit amino acid transport protein